MSLSSGRRGRGGSSGGGDVKKGGQLWPGGACFHRVVDAGEEGWPGISATDEEERLPIPEERLLVLVGRACCWRRESRLPLVFERERELLAERERELSANYGRERAIIRL